MAEQQLLAGRVAIVTGAASGMGRVMARALAGAGAAIAAVDVDAAGLDRLAAEPVFAGTLFRLAADVSKAADCRDAVERVTVAFGALDILINCAGISMSSASARREARIKFFEADAQGWQRIRGDQLHRSVPDGAVRGRTHDQAGLGTHHQRDDELRHHVGGRAVRLRRFQGRP